MVIGPPPAFLDALVALQDPDRWQAVRAELFTMWTTGVDLPALDAHIDEVLAAQQAYAQTHLGTTSSAASHFPMFEIPDDLMTLIEDFAARLG